MTVAGEGPIPASERPASGGAGASEEPGDLFRRLLQHLGGSPGAPTYWLTRVVFLRLLGFIYLIAFLSLSQQLRPLIGENGLLPARAYLERVESSVGFAASALWALPSIFWLDSSDGFMQAAAYAGVALALLVALGMANALLLAAIWFLYMSFVHVGQIFYGYGWEILLLETGFLGIFLCPPLRLHPLPERTPPPLLVIVLLRWLAFRVMFGAGLIKLRGDPCWRDLTCLLYHYETQPLPNPLSWYLHQLPPFIHKLEVLWNHFVELVVPWFVFGPRRMRHVAGVLLVAFQVTLILSGNLSWLNWLTIAVCLACFDDGFLGRFFSSRVRARVQVLADVARTSRLRIVVTCALAALILYLSVNPVLNMLSPNQVMNTSFDRLHLVNTYGAFGSVGRQRHEVVLEGTYDSKVDDRTEWLEYEFKCKPGDVRRRPCVVSPYHYRLDWQIWFAAMSDASHQPWLVHLVYKLLHGDEGALALLGKDPFERGPPRFIRAELYEYEFTQFGESTDAWWKRRRVRPYLPPLSLEDPALRTFLSRQGWLRE